MYAKTLYLPNFPDHVNEEIKSFTRSKLPHFFQYAKDKEEDQVENINGSTVNRLHKIIPNKPIQFKRVVGSFDFRNLMNTKYPAPSETVINTYNKLNRNKRKWQDKNPSSTGFQYDEMVRQELSKLHKSEKYIVDVLIQYLYSSGNKDKEGLWNVYSDIIYENIITNLGVTISCEVCKVRTDSYSDNKKYCDTCQRELQLKWQRESMRKSRKKCEVVKNDKLLL